MRTIKESILKQFYDTYEIEPIENPKYYGIYELLNDKLYPKFTAERFCQLLNVCWSKRLDMNFDHDGLWDTEPMLHRRLMFYEESVLITFIEDFPIYLDGDVFNELCYEIKRIFND